MECFVAHAPRTDGGGSMAARFSIGIDLGTTNSALACVSADRRCGPEAFAVRNGKAPPRSSRRRHCPRFSICRRTPARRGIAQPAIPEIGGWIVGRFARRRAGETPGRRRAVGQVVAVPPFGRPVRADSALGIRGSSAGAKDLAGPRRRAHSERHLQGRLGQPLRRGPASRSMHRTSPSPCRPRSTPPRSA